MNPTPPRTELESGAARRSCWRCRLIFGAIVLLALVHEDAWWREDHTLLVFRVLPISLAYHVGISIAASVLWGLACVFCWPRELSDLDEPDAPLIHGHGRS